MEKYSRLRNWGFFGKFLSVGVLGAVLDNAVLFGLVEFFHLSPTVGKLFSAECAIILMFVVNEFWTFSQLRGRTFRGLVRRFLKSNLVRFGGLAVGVTVLFVLHNVLGVWYLVSNVMGIGVGFVVNYVFESLFTWKIQEG